MTAITAPTTPRKSRPGSRSGSTAQRAIVLRVTLHGVTAEVTAPQSVKRNLSIVFAGYPKADAESTPDISVNVERVENGRATWKISDGTHSYPELDRYGMPAIRAEWLVISDAIKLWPDFVHVHAGLVATEDRSALLIGKSGSGKSTTTMALAMNGISVFTDDVALIDRTTLRAMCVPRPIKLDRKSRAMLRKRGLVVPPRRRLNESIDRSVLPGLPQVEAPGPPLGSVLFFADTRGETASLRPLTGAEAVLRLVQQSASERFDIAGPSAGALAIVNAVPCFELVASDLDSTVKVILDHLQQEPTVAHEAN